MNQNKRIRTVHIIAIDFCGEVAEVYAEFFNEVKTQAKRGKFSDPRNLYLTLVEIEECPTRQISAIERTIDSMSIESFDITIGGGGGFAGRVPNTFFTFVNSIPHKDTLYRLSRDLSMNLHAKGLRIRQRAFVPRIILGRRILWKNTGGHNFASIKLPYIQTPVTSIVVIQAERKWGRWKCSIMYRKALASSCS